MTETTFDPAKHEYTIEGRVVPGVTEILGDTGLREPFFDAEWAADKGTKIHLACHFHNKGTLFWESVDPLIYPYVEAYLRFKRECHVDVIFSEKIFFHETLLYGTTIDTMVKLDFMSERVRAIVEIKSGQPQPSDRLQTAGQILAVRTHPGLWSVKRRFVLYLKENGTYILVEHVDPDDMLDFEAACRVYWRKRR